MASNLFQGNKLVTGIKYHWFFFKFCNCLEKITASFLTNEMEYQLQLGCKHFPALQAISLFFPSFHLLLGIFPFVLIGHSDYCGFGCTTLIEMCFLPRESGTSSSQMGH